MLMNKEIGPETMNMIVHEFIRAWNDKANADNKIGITLAIDFLESELAQVKPLARKFILHPGWLSRDGKERFFVFQRSWDGMGGGKRYSFRFVYLDMREIEAARKGFPISAYMARKDLADKRNESCPVDGWQRDGFETYEDWGMT